MRSSRNHNSRFAFASESETMTVWDAPDEDGVSWQLGCYKQVPLLDLETGRTTAANVESMGNTDHWGRFT